MFPNLLVGQIRAVKPERLLAPLRDSQLHSEREAYVWLGGPVATALLSGPPRAGSEFVAITWILSNVK
jgi:hypothetical protein